MSSSGGEAPPGESTAPTRRERGVAPELVRAGVALVVVSGVAVLAVGAILGSWALESLQHETGPYLSRLGVLGVALLAVGVPTAWASIRDFTSELRYIGVGVDSMVRGDQVGDAITPRTLDELGQLCLSFESLRSSYVAILERERAARRLVESADRDKTEFLTAISHELKTPLNSILGFADVLLEGMDGPLNAAQREDLLIIRGSGEHLMALFNDVLDLSAATSGHLALERDVVHLEPLLVLVARELRGLRRDRPVEIQVEAVPELPALHADRRRLRQVLTNLGSNAVKFTEKGSVVLAADLDEAGVRIEVRDTGVGIPAESLGTIFGEFEQATSERPRARGAGLGLAITRQLVELHGGSIEVQSVVGEGTTFRVVLPVEASS